MAGALQVLKRQGKLQIWGNGEVKAHLRENVSCALNILENISFTEMDLENQDATTWIEEHSEEVQAWGACTS